MWSNYNVVVFRINFTKCVRLFHRNFWWKNNPMWNSAHSHTYMRAKRSHSIASNGMRVRKKQSNDFFLRSYIRYSYRHLFMHEMLPNKLERRRIVFFQHTHSSYTISANIIDENRRIAKRTERFNIHSMYKKSQNVLLFF